MARIVSVVGTTHHPGYYQEVRRPGARVSDSASRQLAWAEQIRLSLERTKPEVVLVVASDHFHQFFYDAMPQWLVGRMSTYRGTFDSERRHFGLPEIQVEGHHALADDLIESAFQDGFDFAFSDDLRLDHGAVVPLIITQPELGLPVVPILTNCSAPPMPTGGRFIALGEALRHAVERSTLVERVAVVVSGNLSLDVGGPVQGLPRPVDPDFDEQVVSWLAGGDRESLVAESVYERMVGHGNITSQFLNFLTMLDLSRDLRLVRADHIQRAGPSVPCFLYEEPPERLGEFEISLTRQRGM